MSYVGLSKEVVKLLASGFCVQKFLFFFLVIFLPVSFNISLLFFAFVGPARNECLCGRLKKRDWRSRLMICASPKSFGTEDACRPFFYYYFPCLFYGLKSTFSLSSFWFLLSLSFYSSWIDRRVGRDSVVWWSFFLPCRNVLLRCVPLTTPSSKKVCTALEACRKSASQRNTKLLPGIFSRLNDPALQSSTDKNWARNSCSVLIDCWLLIDTVLC